MGMHLMAHRLVEHRGNIDIIGDVKLTSPVRSAKIVSFVPLSILIAKGPLERRAFFAESTWLYHTVRQQDGRPGVATGPGPFNQL
jgi:hypothetical protein